MSFTACLGADGTKLEGGAAMTSSNPAYKRRRVDLPAAGQLPLPGGSLPGQLPAMPSTPPALSAFPAGAALRIPQGSLLGQPLTGSVDMQFDAGYFVTLHVAGNEFRGARAAQFTLCIFAIVCAHACGGRWHHQPPLACQSLLEWTKTGCYSKLLHWCRASSQTCIFQTLNTPRSMLECRRTLHATGAARAGAHGAWGGVCSSGGRGHGREQQRRALPQERGHRVPPLAGPPAQAATARAAPAQRGAARPGRAQAE